LTSATQFAKIKRREGGPDGALGAFLLSTLGAAPQADAAPKIKDLREGISMKFRLLAAVACCSLFLASAVHAEVKVQAIDYKDGDFALRGYLAYDDSSQAKRPDAQNIKGRVLALQGGDDPVVSQKEVDAFEAEMRGAHIDWQLVQYGNAVHAYTMPELGTDNSKGAAYNEKADKRSWVAMTDFFHETFNP
jgi:acetyl esterase/lipase